MDSVAPMSRVFAVPPAAEVRRRLPRLISGLVLCGIAYAFIIEADLGLDPWNILHQGVSKHTSIPIGQVSVLVGMIVLLGWIPLRQRIGLGTVLNTLLIGSVMDLVLGPLPEPQSTSARWAYLVAGLALIGLGIGMYIGARLGPGPRDGIMTGVAQRGPSIRLVRTVIELAALVVGWLLGGSLGIGTVLFALTVGPNVQFWLPRFDMGHPPGFEPDLDPEVEPGPTLAGT